MEALVLNNNVAAGHRAAAADVFDSANRFTNVVSVGGCTGTLINSRTILNDSALLLQWRSIQAGSGDWGSVQP